MASGATTVGFRPTCRLGDTTTCVRGEERFSCSRVAGGGSAIPLSTGAWRLSVHYIYLIDLGLVGALLQLFGSGAAVIEFGAGMGCYADALRSRGVRVTAFDGAPHIREQTHGSVGHADLTSDLTATVGSAEWVMALEVGEHIPPHAEDAFLHNIVSHASTGIVLSWSDGMGNGHLNPRPQSYVRRKMGALGWDLNANVTRLLRSSVSSVRWLRDNLQAFRLGVRGASAERRGTSRSAVPFQAVASSAVKSQGRATGQPDPPSSTCSYSWRMSGAYTDGRRCGSCCGAPEGDDRSSPMCRGSTWDGVLYNLSRAAVEHRCSHDAGCLGFYTSTRPMTGRWLLKAGLHDSPRVGRAFRPVGQWRAGRFINATNVWHGGWQGFEKRCHV